ncbi:MAG: aminodeoxychorismate synthase component I [Cyclobacteriaceae bacterium]|nr:aminodeoxychorismate synthase component I [Cyclobacteriaceae bacterium]
MGISEFSDTLNQLAKNATPFIFFIDFELKTPVVFRMDEVDSNNILFDFNGITNQEQQKNRPTSVIISVQSDLGEEHQRKFEQVHSAIKRGDSFLTNLTIKNKVTLSHSLKDIFYASHAKYKLWYRDEFVVFSPESFIQIKDQKVYSYPMKGTIDADIPNAAEILLMNRKEMAEHVTIVDLIRSDLSRVASKVSVEKFRYVEKLNTNKKNLLQISSEIKGDLPRNYLENIGSILVSLLPAGSVCGAPKPKTLSLIKDAELEERGYYTGVCGHFDGQSLDSGVMIRFIEKKKGEYHYRSGGGITSQSDWRTEYEEVINKIYVPVD